MGFFDIFFFNPSAWFTTTTTTTTTTTEPDELKYGLKVASSLDSNSNIVYNTGNHGSWHVIYSDVITDSTFVSTIELDSKYAEIFNTFKVSTYPRSFISPADDSGLIECTLSDDNTICTLLRPSHGTTVATQILIMAR